MKKLLYISKFILICISLIFSFTMNCEGYDKDIATFLLAVSIGLMVRYLQKRIYEENEIKKEAEDLKEITDFISENNEIES